jgi:hypothetical protein
VSDFLLFLLAFTGLLAFLLVLGGLTWCWDAWQVRRVRREAARHAAIRQHPARRSLRRRRALGGPCDGEPLSEDDLNEFTGIMFASGYDGWQEDEARETSAGEETEYE